MAEAMATHGCKRTRSTLLVVLVSFLLALLFRHQLLRGLGSFLIQEDSLAHADAIYVLGGAPLDRGTYAAELLQRQLAPIAYATGSNHSSVLKVEGRLVTEAELTCHAAVRAGALKRKILPFPYGTSTYEEAQGVLYHARHIDADTILVLTTDFHTRRVGKVFRKRLDRKSVV